MLFRLYIGSENKTGVISAEQEQKTKDMLGERFASFTYQRATGVFRGKEEETLVVTLANVTKEDVFEVAEKIRLTFHQDGVGVEYDGTYERVTD